MQAQKLYYHQEQEKAGREAGDKEILQVLSETHASQGSEVTGGSLYRKFNVRKKSGR
jgi:hypothetical protein